MTVPFLHPPTNPQFIALPPGYGRRLRVSAVTVGVLQVLVLVYILAGMIYGAVSERDAGDPLWLVSATTGPASYPALIGVVVNLFRARGGLSGDFVCVPKAGRLHAVLRGWWIASLVVAVGALVGQAIGCVWVFGTGTRHVSILDVFPFVYVILAAGIGVGTYITGRSLLVPSPQSLAKMWATARRLAAPLGG